MNPAGTEYGGDRPRKSPFSVRVDHEVFDRVSDS